MPKFIDITNRLFGRWTALSYSGARKWLCRCSCGAEKLVDGPTLRNGASTSCGCSRLEAPRHFTHGMAAKGTTFPEWHTWERMKQRCYNRNNKSWPAYGGRGITVCESWRKSFAQFYEDMGPRPDKFSLDRKDNDGPYSPENCRWANWTTQARNRRSNRYIAFNGETRLLTEWAERTGISAGTIWFRLNKGWGIPRALTTAVR